MDAPAEADVLGGVRASGSKSSGSVEARGSRLAEPKSSDDPRAQRDRLTGDLEAVGEHPALEELERRIEADHLLERGGGRHLAR